MRILADLNNPLKDSIALTIGNFDGMHFGHQAVLKRLKEVQQHIQVKSALITFKNHPAEILKNVNVDKICSLEHKIKLFEELEIDYLYLLDFTREFSELTAQEFLSQITTLFPLQALVLGHDATIGKNRTGNQDFILNFCKVKNIFCEYVRPLLVNDRRVSSSLVKECIRQGDLNQLEAYLGRAYSILATVQPGSGQGKTMGFPTANLAVDGLCLPPLGVYAVFVKFDNKIVKGIANIGVAPTVKNSLKPVLEVHLFDYEEDIYGKTVETIFVEFIRPEERFQNIEKLKEQIKQDIKTARKILSLGGT